jgi:hypothetical protein
MKRRESSSLIAMSTLWRMIKKIHTQKGLPRTIVIVDRVGIEEY